MSKKSGSFSSNNSAGSLKRCVQKILIESDQQQKNTRKLGQLKHEFPVLRKIHPTTTNNQKLQFFLRDSHFQQKVCQKLNKKVTRYSNYKIRLEDGIPILKAYLVSTNFNSQIEDQFDETDLVYVFQKFGFVTQIYVADKFAYILYQQIVSVFLAERVLNQFTAKDRVRLRVRICNQEELNQAISLFHKKYRSAVHAPQPGSLNSVYLDLEPSPSHLKYIAKFEFGVQSLPEFNIAQRIIGPKGNYMKRIIENILSRHPLPHNYNLSNIDSVFKIRIRGKGSGLMEAGGDSDEKMHLFISSKEKWMYETACQEVQALLLKVFQDYKLQFQKLFRMYSSGVAYRVLQNQAGRFRELRRVNLEDIEETVDLLILGEEKLGEKIIKEKIKQREEARKHGRFEQADWIRNWLKCRGVVLVDPKSKHDKTTWKYLHL